MCCEHATLAVCPRTDIKPLRSHTALLACFAVYEHGGAPPLSGLHGSSCAACRE